MALGNCRMGREIEVVKPGLPLVGRLAEKGDVWGRGTSVSWHFYISRTIC